MKRKGKKGVMSKTWERCKSISMGEKKRMRWFVEEKGKGRVAPQGCFSVYVGPQKQRFVIKTEHANHPLFKMLLEEAESEYGYNSQGPLALPCDVDMFYKVLMQMDQDDHADDEQEATIPGCVFLRRCGSYHLLSPSSSRMLY